MRKPINGLKPGHRAAAAVVAIVGLFSAALSGAETPPDFTNPAVGISSAAVIASGECIARYTVMLDDRIRPAGEIGQLVARHCAKAISRSAGLASWMAGRPEDFAKNLKYTREELTTNAVLRHRASPKNP